MNQDVAARHIVRAMRSQFAQNADGQVRRNLITGDAIPLRRLVEIDQQAYNASSLERWRQEQLRRNVIPVVPHTRQPITNVQFDAMNYAQMAPHPMEAFRRRKTIAGALKHEAVVQFVQIVCNLRTLCDKLTKQYIRSSCLYGLTIKEAGHSVLDLPYVDGYLDSIGYRLQIERERHQERVDILPIHNFIQLGKLRASSFQNGGVFGYWFYLVPIGMRGLIWNELDYDTRPPQGVIKLSEPS